MKKILSVPVLLSVFIASSCGRVSPPKTLTPVTVGYSSLTGDDLPLFVAADRGLFAKNGLAVSLNHMDTGPVVVSALVSGSALAVMASGGAAASAAAHGADVVVVAGGVQRMSMVYFGSPDVSEKKKPIKTVFAVKGGESGDALVLAEEHGLIPKTAIAVSIEAGENAKIEALKHGQLDAAPLGVSSVSEAERAGLTPIFRMDQFGYPASVLMTTGKLIRSQPDVLKQLLRAYTEAEAVIASDQAATVKAIENRLGFSLVQAKETYDAYRDYFAEAPLVQLGQFALVGNGAKVRIDNSLLKEVIQGRS